MTTLSAVLSTLILLTALAVFAAPAFALWMVWRIGTAAASREARTCVILQRAAPESSAYLVWAAGIVAEVEAADMTLREAI